MFSNPGVEIGLCAAQEARQNTPLLHQPDDGQVYVVVPIGHGFVVGQLAVLFPGEVVVMDVDHLRQDFVLAGHCDPQFVLGAQTGQGCVLQKVGVFGFDDHRVQVVARLQGNVRLDFGDEGVDVLGLHLAGHGDPVVAVLDKVDIAQFVDVDGGQPFLIQHSPAHAGPAVAVAVPLGQKAAGEVLVAAHAAHNRGQRNRALDPLAGGVGFDVGPHLLEREQVRGAPQQASPQPFPIRGQTGRAELAVDGVGFGVVGRVIHCCCFLTTKAQVTKKSEKASCLCGFVVAFLFLTAADR